MQSKKGGDFHVALNGIELSDASRNRIQAAIQKAVMTELAGYPNPEGDDKPSRLHIDTGVIAVFPRWWWGFILRQVRPNEIDALQGLGPQINSKTYELHQ